MTDSIKAAQTHASHDEQVPPSKPRIAYPELTVLSSIVETSAGRDKTLKVVQYGARNYLYLLKLVLGLHVMKRDHVQRLGQAVGSLSLARKCMILFSPLTPLILLLQSDSSTAPTTLIASFIALLNGIADDMFCLSRLGLLNKRRGLWADKWANRFWLMKSVNQFYKLEISRAKSGTDLVDFERRDRWTYRKLACDIIFASYTVFDITKQRELVQNVTGLMAGLISMTQLYTTHHAKLYSVVK